MIKRHFPAMPLGRPFTQGECLAPNHPKRSEANGGKGSPSGRPVVGAAVLSMSIACAACLVSTAGNAAEAAGGDASLTQKLSNPVASLISIPIEADANFDVGPNDTESYVLKLKPVVPFSWNENWNLISRTIVPAFVKRNDVPKHDSGMGDVNQSFFFSPKAVSNGVIWGVGPSIQLPTATHKWIGQGRWGLGPTGVVLVQRGSWTYGVLLAHVWSVGGRSNREDYANTLLQPFATYDFHNGWRVSANMENTYNWKGKGGATVPLNVSGHRLAKLGSQLVDFELGVRSYLESPSSGADIGAFFTATLLLPD
ncbi:transporter [Dokdonella sp.]|uniref:transporter n=1 Tax=Dokdonella sp. TaxID=2291710 RepID=UPI001B2F7036|nr:transporter [Dokdonella sp.]MBO9664209.1 transporter [Dokdonella sp.]